MEVDRGHQRKRRSGDDGLDGMGESNAHRSTQKRSSLHSETLIAPLRNAHRSTQKRSVRCFMTSVSRADVTHGMRLKLKGPEDVWDEPATFVGRAPLPSCWAAGGGALTLSGSSLSAHSGARKLEAAERLELRFDLVTTPVKKRNPKHFKWRYDCRGTHES
eukprot:SAG11_NODE_759_length_7305_cov_2.494865_8_plen_161_part_00